MTETTCPTCGCPVRIVRTPRDLGGDEGTHHYEPITPALTEAERAVVEKSVQYQRAVLHQEDDPGTPNFVLLMDAKRDWENATEYLIAARAAEGTA